MEREPQYSNHSTTRLRRANRRHSRLRWSTSFARALIPAVTDFRQLSKIATGVENIGLRRDDAVRSLDAVFDPTNDQGIREAYAQTVEFGYNEKDAARRLQSLTEFLDRILETRQVESLDDDFLDRARELHGRLTQILES